VSPDDAATIALLDAIRRGELDHHLLRLETIIRERMRTPDWLTHIVVNGQRA